MLFMFGLSYVLCAAGAYLLLAASAPRIAYPNWVWEENTQETDHSVSLEKAA